MYPTDNSLNVPNFSHLWFLKQCYPTSSLFKIINLQTKKALNLDIIGKRFLINQSDACNNSSCFIFKNKFPNKWLIVKNISAGTSFIFLPYAIPMMKRIFQDLDLYPSKESECWDLTPVES